MILSELHEISTIDSEIGELHERLNTLYKQRADIMSIKNNSSAGASQSIEDSINLDGIDLSL